MTPLRPYGRRARASPRRSRRAYVWLTEDEHTLLADAAARDGLSIGGYAAATAVAVARGELAALPVSEADRWRALGQARLEAARLRDRLDALAEQLTSLDLGVSAELLPLARAVAAAVTRLDQATAALPTRRRGRPHRGSR